jgi:hypothetical protein
VPGAETEGTLSVSSEGTGARFEYRFRAHFARAGGCFGSERDLRDRQWRFLSAYVADVEKAFTTPGASR